MPAVSTPPARQRWLVPALIVVVSLTVGCGLLARELYKEPEGIQDSPVAVPRSTPLAPHEQPGPGTVVLTPGAASHPQEDAVRSLFQTYFDAINERDYASWSSTVTKQRVQSKTRSEWLKDYRTTNNGSVVIYRIESAADEQLHALVEFTSTQDPADAPVETPESCIRWHLTLPLAVQNGSWKLATVPAGTTPEHSRC